MKRKLAVVFLLLIGMSISAQTSQDRYESLRGLSSGTLLRIETDSIGPICGQLDSMSLGAETLFLAAWPQTAISSKDDRKQVYKPLSSRAEISASNIKRLYSRGNKAGSGALLGALAGGLVWLAFAKEDEPTGIYAATSDNKNQGFKFASYTLVGAAVGGIIGIAIPSWKRVYSRN